MQVGVEDYTPTITYGGGDDSAAAAPKTDFSDADSFGEAFAEARSNLGPGETFTYNGTTFSTAVFGLRIQR